MYPLIKITKTLFSKALIGVSKVAYGDKPEIQISNLVDFVFEDKYDLTPNKIEDKIKDYHSSEHYYLLKRTLLTSCIFYFFEFKESININKDDIRYLWNLLYEVFINNSQESLYYGSQGFYTLPIAHWKNNVGFTVLRLHIWDTESDANFDERFMIHSHLCHANSLVLYGTITNSEYSIELNDRSSHSLFTVNWKSSPDKNINQQISYLLNTKNTVSVIKTNERKLVAGESYEIEAGKFHSTISTDSLQKANLASTLFLFDSEQGWSNEGFVVGPKDIDEIETKRLRIQNTSEILIKINQKINDI